MSRKIVAWNLVVHPKIFEIEIAKYSTTSSIFVELSRATVLPKTIRKRPCRGFSYTIAEEIPYISLYYIIVTCCLTGLDGSLLEYARRPYTCCHWGGCKKGVSGSTRMRKRADGRRGWRNIRLFHNTRHCDSDVTRSLRCCACHGHRNPVNSMTVLGRLAAFSGAHFSLALLSNLL